MTLLCTALHDLHAQPACCSGHPWGSAVLLLRLFALPGLPRIHHYCQRVPASSALTSNCMQWYRPFALIGMCCCQWSVSTLCYCWLLLCHPSERPIAPRHCLSRRVGCSTVPGPPAWGGPAQSCPIGYCTHLGCAIHPKCQGLPCPWFPLHACAYCRCWRQRERQCPPVAFWPLRAERRCAAAHTC